MDEGRRRGAPRGRLSAPASKARKQGAHPVREHLHQQRQPAELSLRHGRRGVVQLGVEVVRERLADAPHEIAHQAGAADLGQRPGERVADDDIDAGGLASSLARERGEPVVDAARGARAAAPVSAAAFDDLAELGGELPQRTLAGEARRYGPILASSRPTILSPTGGPSKVRPGMQRATASTSDMSAHTAARGCGSTKLWAMRVSPPASSSGLTLTWIGARVPRAPDSAGGGVGVMAVVEEVEDTGVETVDATGPGAGPSQERAEAAAAVAAPVPSPHSSVGRGLG